MPPCLQHVMIWRCGISHPGTHIHVDTPVLSQCTNSWMLRPQMLTMVPPCFAAGYSAFQPLRAQVLIYSTAPLFPLTTQSDHSTACPMARLHLSSGSLILQNETTCTVTFSCNKRVEDIGTKVNIMKWFLKNK